MPVQKSLRMFAGLSVLVLILLLACGRMARQSSGAFALKDIAASGDVTLLEGADNPLGEPCLRLTTSGRLNLPVEQSRWDSSRYLLLDVIHEAGVSGAVVLHFYEKGDSTSSFTTLMGVMPGLRTRLVFPLSELDAHRVFLPRTPGRLKAVMWGRPTRPGMLSAVTVELDSMAPGQKLYVCRVGLSDSLPGSYPVDGPPVVDSLGQWHARDWPGKTENSEALKNNLGAALATAGNSAFPQDWSRFGGWKKLRFKPSGFFRVEKTATRYWLVDPEGCAFFSTGVDGVGPVHNGTPVEGIENLFMWLPPREGEYAPGWDEQWDKWSADFEGFNLIRAFGPSWREDWAKISRARMLDWRFNTLGNWSDELAVRSFGLPYVIPLRGFPSAGGEPIFRDFPDVYDPAYERNAVAWAAQLESSKDDPLMIGYFLDNEPQWAFSSQLPAASMLETGKPSATRSAMVEWLKERYKDDLGALNSAWGQSFGAFDELAQGSLHRPEEFSSQAREDLAAFSEQMVRHYLEPAASSARSADPNHLNLGIRWAGLGRYCALAGQYCDVFSVNMYRMLPDTTALRQIAEQSGRPVLIGEYHFGATDRGLPSTGLRGVTDQTQRGLAYRAYVETAASMPFMVGTHYFIWNDQPVFGRFDGENYNIGVVDVCNTPYLEFVEAARLTHERIYGVASGEIPPTAERAKEVPRIGF